MALQCCSTSPLWRRVHAGQPQLVIDSKRPKKANVLVEALRKTRPEFGPMWLEGVAHASRVQKFLSLSLSVFLSLCAPGLCFGVVVVVAAAGGPHPPSPSLSLYGTPPARASPGASVNPAAGRSQVPKVCNCQILPPNRFQGGVVARCAHGARTVRARCAHGSMFLGWLPNLYPVEWPP